MTRQILQVEFDYSFELIALVTPLRDYRVCWHLNRVLGIDFRKTMDHVVHLPIHRKQVHFSCFLYYNELDKVHLYLLSNRTEGDFLIPELRQADHLLMIKGSMPDEEKQIILNKLKTIRPLQTFFEVNPLELKSRQNLLFDDPDL